MIRSPYKYEEKEKKIIKGEIIKQTQERKIKCRRLKKEKK